MASELRKTSNTPMRRFGWVLKKMKCVDGGCQVHDNSLAQSSRFGSCWLHLHEGKLHYSNMHMTNRLASHKWMICASIEGVGWMVRYVRVGVSQTSSLIKKMCRPRWMVDCGAMVVRSTMSWRQIRLMVVALWSIWAHLQGSRCQVARALWKMDWVLLLWGFIAFSPKMDCVEANPSVYFEHAFASGHALLKETNVDGSKQMSVEALRDMKWMSGHYNL